ncbi:MAG: hypothetical protein LBR99_06105, partial [Treponema sp.]|nr:hypothetical protein [Treponema sp.]
VGDERGDTRPNGSPDSLPEETRRGSAGRLPGLESAGHPPSRPRICRKMPGNKAPNTPHNPFSHTFPPTKLKRPIGER